jgi:hypothetical protein
MSIEGRLSSESIDSAQIPYRFDRGASVGRILQHRAQDQPAVNSPAIFRTIVPHINSITHPIHLGGQEQETVGTIPPGFT